MRIQCAFNSIRFGCALNAHHNELHMKAPSHSSVLRLFHTRPKNRIQFASNAHSSCSHLHPVLGDAHSIRIESIHLWRWIGTESEPDLLFIHWITIKSRTVTPPRTATLSKLSRLGHHTRCIRHPRYEVRWPIMLGRHWLLAVEKEIAYRVVPCRSSKFTFHIVCYSDKEFVCFDASRMLAQ